MKRRVCVTCDQLYYCDNPIEMEGKEFHSVECLKKYYLKRIKDLENSIKIWKEAWFEMRKIVGELGYKHEILLSYKINEEDRLIKDATDVMEHYYPDTEIDNDVVELHELLDSNVYE